VRSRPLRSGLALWALLLAPLAAAAADAPRPHVVFFLADDLGWGDVGYQGSEIPTPHIDALAERGVRLERFYTLPACTPTRAALLTGRHPIRYGLQEGVVWPWAGWGLPTSERTLAVALGAVGYRPLLVGKWHLGHARAEQLPRARGFAHHYGPYLGAIDHFTHLRDGGLDWHRNGAPVREPGYATFLLANEAVRLVRGHDAAQPLFLLVSFTAPHTPLQAPDPWLARVDGLDGDRRTFAAMVAVMDEAVGRVIAALRERGMADDTLVVFASDNGGIETHGADNGPLRGEKNELFEGGVRVPAVAAWPGRLPAGAVVTAPVHAVDWYPTLLALAGGRPEDPPHPLDGRDVLDALTGEPQPPRDLLLNVTERGGAVLSGRWKLVSDATGTRLFDVEADPAETRDVAAEHRDVARRLSARLRAWADEAVPPLQDPAQREGFGPPEVWGPHAGRDAKGDGSPHATPRAAVDAPRSPRRFGILAPPSAGGAE